MEDTVLFEKLRNWGCDVEGALARFAGDKEMYISFLSVIAHDEQYDLLESALACGNATDAFEAAHALKGMLGNMGITPMFTAVTGMVEIFRKGSIDNAEESCTEFFSLRDKLISIIGE